MVGLDDRRAALEEAFFRAEDERLRRELRARKLAEHDAEALARATGMEGLAPLMTDLVQQGVTAETLPALFLVPLVAVAWADDEVAQTERLELMAQARDLGVEPGSASHQLLGRWLENRPPTALFEAWRDYASALSASVDGEQRGELARELLWRAREVAKADGGVLGIGRRVSAMERQVLEELEGVFRSV